MTLYQNTKTHIWCTLPGKCKLCKTQGRADCFGWRWCPTCDTLFRTGVYARKILSKKKPKKKPRTKPKETP